MSKVSSLLKRGSVAVLASFVLAGCGGSSSSVQTASFVVPTSFIDPTATVSGSVSVGSGVYVAPFAAIQAGTGAISLGDGTNVQDNCQISASLGQNVTVGSRVIIAHGATIVGPATVGQNGGLPAFIGFNAKVEGAVLEPDTYVGTLCHVAPGIVLHSGTKVLPGRDITTQQEADDVNLGKVVALSAADRTFMDGVLGVNGEFASEYPKMQAASPGSVQGVAPQPVTTFQVTESVPTLNSVATTSSGFRNRIVGDVRLADSLSALDALLGLHVSLRADEGTPFIIGNVTSVANSVTMHALEHTSVTLGNLAQIGAHAVIHGGTDSGNPTPTLTSIGNSVNIGANAVVFRSTVGNNVTIGAGAIVDGCQLTDNTVVPAHTIMVKNVNQGTITW